MSYGDWDEMQALRKENDTLRGLLGSSAQPCPYCGLPAEEQGSCKRGFPGCPRADDQMLFKHFADGFFREQAERRIDELERQLEEARQEKSAQYTCGACEKIFVGYPKKGGLCPACYQALKVY